MRGGATAIGVGVSALALVACSSGPPPPSSSPATSSSAAAATLDGMVAIGSDRLIHATCAGFTNPGPAVVLVSGAQSSGETWAALRKPGHTGLALTDLEKSDAAVFGQVAQFAPVCSYDRPATLRLNGSVSSSTKVKQPTTAMDGVADLEAWLSAAQVTPPYVLVGHSWGGMIATLFAATYPSETAGLVLVDPATTFLEDELTDAQWQAFLDVARQMGDGSGKEVPDYENTVGTVRAADLPTLPAVVLTSDREFDFGAGPGTWPAWLAAASDLASSLRASHVTRTDSGHLIPVEQPAQVVDAIRTVLGAPPGSALE